MILSDMLTMMAAWPAYAGLRTTRDGYLEESETEKVPARAVA